MKRMSRILSVLVATVLLMTVCATAFAEVETDLMSPYGKYPELITLTNAKRSSSAPNFAEGESLNDNAMTRYIKEKINVEIKTLWEVEGTEFINKLSLNIAANDLPDMFSLGMNDYLVYRQLLENDMLADLSEGYEKCAGDYMKEVFASFENRNLEPFTENGKLYGIAGGRYGYEHDQLWFRQDWLDKSGLAVPKTVAELENVLKTWKDNPPAEGYVGMALNATDPLGAYSSQFSATPIFEAFGATPKTWVKDANGEVVWGSVMPQIKEGLAVLAKWYADGLIDQQFATRTAGGATTALFTGGLTGTVFSPWWGGYSFPEIAKNNPEAVVGVTNAPLDANGKYNVVWPGPAGDVLVVNKNFAHPEAVVKVMNIEFDMWRKFDPKGAELVQADRDANVDWGYLFPTDYVNLEYADIIPNVGLLAKNLIENGKLEGAATATDMDKEMATEAKKYADTKSLDGMGWVHYHGRYLASNIVNTPEVNVIYPVFSYSTESMADLKPNLDTLESQTMLQIITGEKPVDYFDEFVKAWYEQGGQTITDEVKAMTTK